MEQNIFTTMDKPEILWRSSSQMGFLNVDWWVDVDDLDRWWPCFVVFVVSRFTCCFGFICTFLFAVRGLSGVTLNCLFTLWSPVGFVLEGSTIPIGLRNVLLFFLHAGLVFLAGRSVCFVLHLAFDLCTLVPPQQFRVFDRPCVFLVAGKSCVSTLSNNSFSVSCKSFLLQIIFGPKLCVPKNFHCPCF